MEIFEKAYTAGFLDADGSVTMAKNGANSYRHPLVTFFNNDLVIIEWLQNHWGGKIKIRKQVNPKWNTSYDLNLNTGDSLACLKEILPYMIHEKKVFRAKLIVDHYEEYTPKNGKYTEEMALKKRNLEEKIMSLTMRGTSVINTVDTV